MPKLIGWVSCYLAPYSESELTKEKKQEIIEVVRRRHYDYTQTDLCFVPYSAPFFDDATYCVPNKSEWDDILNKAYENKTRIHRLLPDDAIKTSPEDEILFESDSLKKYYYDNKR